VLSLIMNILAILSCVFIYKMAKWVGKNPLPWCILSFLFFPIGLIISFYKLNKDSSVPFVRIVRDFQ